MECQRKLFQIHIFNRCRKAEIAQLNFIFMNKKVFRFDIEMADLRLGKKAVQSVSSLSEKLFKLRKRQKIGKSFLYQAEQVGVALFHDHGAELMGIVLILDQLEVFDRHNVFMLDFGENVVLCLDVAALL